MYEADPSLIDRDGTARLMGTSIFCSPTMIHLSELEFSAGREGLKVGSDSDHSQIQSARKQRFGNQSFKSGCCCNGKTVFFSSLSASLKNHTNNIRFYGVAVSMARHRSVKQNLLKSIAHY